MSDPAVSQEAEGSPTILLWRQSLARAPRVPRAADIDAWAGHLAAVGIVSPLLERCAALLRGVGGAVAAAPEQWTVDVALDELKWLAGSIGGEMTLAPPARPGWSGTPDNPAGIAPDRGGGLPGDLLALADNVTDALAADANPETDARLLAGLAALRDLDRRFPRLDYRDWHHAPLPALLAAIALVTLVDFALRTQDLWAGSYGSAGTMRAAAGLGVTGLGAYAGRVGLIARSSADIYDLARTAVAATPAAPADAREAWICFLCRSCRSDLLFEVIDDLGDVAASRSLAKLLAMASDRLDVDIGLLWRIRDAAIDTGDHDLAITAQRRVAQLRDGNGGEMIILGSLCVGGGQVAEAATTFRELAARGWPGAVERLQALQTGSFAPYLLDRGFTSPADRQATRLHRRGDAFAYPRAKGGRIDAVDVG